MILLNVPEQEINSIESQQVLIFVIAFKRVLFLCWNLASYETTKYPQPKKKKKKKKLTELTLTKAKVCMSIMNLNLEGLRREFLVQKASQPASQSRTGSSPSLMDYDRSFQN